MLSKLLVPYILPNKTYHYCTKYKKCKTLNSLKFGRWLNSNAAEPPAKFQSKKVISTSNIMASNPERLSRLPDETSYLILYPKPDISQVFSQADGMAFSRKFMTCSRISGNIFFSLTLSPEITPVMISALLKNFLGSCMRKEPGQFCVLEINFLCKPVGANTCRILGYYRCFKAHYMSRSLLPENSPL